MVDKKEIKRQYKLAPRPAGVFQIKNNVNGKILLGSSLNLDGILNRHKFQLELGSHMNKELQTDWKEFGAVAFTFEILETLDPKDDPNFNYKDELSLLEEIWLEKLQPFGEMGYNRDSKIRYA